MGAGQETTDVQSGGSGNLMSCGVGGVEVVPEENPGVGGTELYHQLLFIIMSHQRNIHKKDLLCIARVSGAVPLRLQENKNYK